MTTKFNTLGIKSLNNLTDINGTSISATNISGDNINASNLTATAITSTTFSSVNSTNTNTTSTNIYCSGIQGVQGSFGYLSATDIYSNSLNGINNFLTGIQGFQASYNFIGCQVIQGQQGYLSSSLNTKDIFTTGVQGVQANFGYIGCQTLVGLQGYLNSSLNTKDIFTTGIQGTQSFFRFSGVQSITGQQGYLSSSLNTKDIFTTGIQGVQASFGYIGCQTLVLSGIQASANMFMTSNNARITMTGSDPRIGIGVASPFYTLDIAGGVNLQSTSNVFRVAGVPVIGGDSNGAYVPQRLNVVGQVDINDYCFFRNVCIRLSRTGSWSISANSSILSGMTTNFARNYSGTMYDSGTGNITVPLSGYYRVSCYVRFSDTSSDRGIKPTIQGVRYCIDGDNTYWCPDDPSGFFRRCLQWSETNVLTAGQSYNIQMSNTGTLQEVIFCMELIST